MIAKVRFTKSTAGSARETEDDHDDERSERFWADGRIFRDLLGDRLKAPGDEAEVNWFGPSRPATVTLHSVEQRISTREDNISRRELGRDGNLEVDLKGLIDVSPGEGAIDQNHALADQESKRLVQQLSLVCSRLSRSVENITREVLNAMESKSFVLLVGPHGSGKSMLLDAISETFGRSACCLVDEETPTLDLIRRIDSCSKGIVVIDDVDIKLPRDVLRGENALRRVAISRALARARLRGCFALGSATDPDRISKVLLHHPCFDALVRLRAPQLEERFHQLISSGIETSVAFLVSQRTGGWSRAELSSVARTISALSLSALAAEDQEGLVNEAIMQLRPTTSIYRDRVFLASTTDTLSNSPTSSFTASSKLIVGLTLERSTLENTVIKFLNDVKSMSTARAMELLDVKTSKVSNEVQILSNNSSRGILLHGSSGNGKTTLGMALGQFVQGNGLANFLCVRCLDLVSKYVGETEMNVARVFQRARDCAPCVLFLDHVDAIAMNRANGMSETTERTFERVLSVLLVEMDGALAKSEDTFHDKVIVIGATREMNQLDAAIVRPGRLGTHIFIQRPMHEQDRYELFKFATAKTPVQASSEFIHEELCGRLLSGRSRAQIVGMCREAATLALREDVSATVVEERHFRAACSSI